MPRVISEAFPREDTNLHTSHTGTSHKEPAHDHQQTLDEKQTIFPREGSRKHHDHHTQREMEVNTWAAQNNAKTHTFIPPEEQSEATAPPNYNANNVSGKTFSHKHKFDRELDHRHPKNENTRELYKWEDEQNRLSQPDVIDAKRKENDKVDKESQSGVADETRAIEDKMRRQLMMDKNANVQYPSDTVSAATESEFQHRIDRKQKSDERQRLAAEQAERSQRDDVQHPQHAIPEPVISRAETEDDSAGEMDRSAPEKAMGSGISGTTVAHNERVNKSESSRM